MKLEDLKDPKIPETSKVLEGEVLEEEKFEEEEEDVLLEADLSEALSLLEDCWHLFETLSSPERRGRISYELSQEVERLKNETSSFLYQYEDFLEGKEEEEEGEEKPGVL